MHMRVMRQRGTPRVQHRHEADAGAQMPARGRHLHLAEADVPRVGATPRGAVVAEDVRNLQSWTLHDPRPLRRRLTLATSSGPLTWVLGRRLGKLPQLVERAHDAGDHAGRNTRVARCRLQLVVSERTRVIMHLLLTS